MLDAAFGFLVLCALCALFASLRGVSGALAPLLGVSTTMVYFTLAGVLGVLVPAFWVFCAGVLGLFCVLLYRRRAAALAPLFSPGFLLFFCTGLVLFVYYALRQPMFSQWDEMSFWGTAAKLLVQDNALYTTADTGYFWTMTERPALSVFSWFFQYLGAGFAPWKVYWAYALVLLACLCVLLHPFAGRRWRSWVPFAVAGLATPFFFTVPNHTVHMASTWLDAYGDLPGGLLFGGTVALYFMLAGQKSPAGGQAAGGATALLAALPLAALALVKDNIVPVALVAGGMLAVDSALFAPRRAAHPGGKAWTGQGFVQRAGSFLFWFAVPAAMYVLWNNHAAWAATGGGATNIPLSQAVGQALREITGRAPASEAYLAVRSQLWNNFLGRTAAGQSATFRVSMAGTPLVSCLFIAAVFLAALLLFKGRRERLRCAAAWVLGALGFAAYHFMLLVHYGFYSHQAGEVVDYSRYLTSYLSGWFLLGLGLFALAAGGAKTLRAVACRAAALALAVFMAVQCGRFVRPGYSVLDWPETTYAAARKQEETARAIAANMPAGQRIFYVCQGGNGEEYFAWHYHLLPAVLDYSYFAGRTFPLPGDEYYISVTRMNEYLYDTGCDYILIDALDAAFVRYYGSLFEDRLAGYAGGTALYHRGQNGLFSPVPLTS
ncbi:hypothetical protein LJC04_04580 [Ruminococcaceae bacterium OttesenSCG-928-O06]|nr:hypothetical protein [Ruminococcaceae bacterium OttesenSCG-928-O06]